MFQRQQSGSVVCRSCSRLVGVRDEKCSNCGAGNPALWGFSPLLRRYADEGLITQIIVFLCAAFYTLSLVADLAGIRNQGLLSLLAPSGSSLLQFGASGPLPVIGFGRWWTLLSAGLLHGGLLHIGFNMMWMLQIGPLVARFYGAGRMMVIFTAGSLGGFALSTMCWFFPRPLRIVFEFGRNLDQAHYTMGASAPIFGLLAALIYYGRRSGSSALTQQIWMWVGFLGIFGFLIRGVDNWAHLGGFLGGYLACKLLDPMQPERLNHLLLGAICLVATVLAVVVSLLVPFSF